VLLCCKCFLYFQQYDRLVPPEVLEKMPQKLDNFLKIKSGTIINVFEMTLFALR
jgi:hypothetical protein